MWFTRISITNPVMATMAMLALVVLGRFDDAQAQALATEAALLTEGDELAAAKVRLDDTFRFEHVYYPRYRRYGGEHVRKTVVVFLGWLDEEVPIRVSEHEGHEWIPWPPPPRFTARAKSGDSS